MSLRQYVLVTHRWIGLSTSIVLAVAGATGTFIVFVGDAEGWLGFPRRVAGRLHESLALGSAGHVIVIAATAASILLQFGGAWLWWRTKRIRVETGRGWRRALIDLHHALGILSLPLMFVMSATALAMYFRIGMGDPEVGRLIARLHKGHFPFPVNALWAIASFGFVVQGVTGVVMWWKPNGKGRPHQENKVRR